MYRGRDAAEDAVLGATLALQIRDNPLTLDCLELIAAFAASSGDVRRAATILAATAAVREATGLPPDGDEAAIRQIALERLGPERSIFADAWDEGRGMDLGMALEAAKADGGAVQADRPRGTLWSTHRTVEA